MKILPNKTVVSTKLNNSVYSLKWYPDKMKCIQRQQYLLYEELEDTKWVIIIRKSKKDRQHNGQKKTDKRTKNDLQNIYIHRCIIS